MDILQRYYYSSFTKFLQNVNFVCMYFRLSKPRNFWLKNIKISSCGWRNVCRRSGMYRGDSKIFILLINLRSTVRCICLMYLLINCFFLAQVQMQSSIQWYCESAIVFLWGCTVSKINLCFVMLLHTEMQCAIKEIIFLSFFV